MRRHRDPFAVKKKLTAGEREYLYYSLKSLEQQGIKDISRMPFSLKIILESLLRQIDSGIGTADDVSRLLEWNEPQEQEIPLIPARVIMQDLTGVPSLVDLAAMRDAMIDLHGDPSRINPELPVDLVIDHSLQVDHSGTARALEYNTDAEFKRNRERYEFLRWGARSFTNFRVVPPSTGIVHQINLEYLSTVVRTEDSGGETLAFPDTVIGTDSHTTMINGIGVLGWGVGGIEAEAVILGRPLYMLIPEVIGFRLIGRLPEGVNATDLVLTVTQMLRAYGVVGKIVEFFGPGLKSLTVADRATISNMSPEYGATAGFFPVDRMTISYLQATGRPPALVDLVETYTREQGLFREEDSTEPLYKDVIELDLGAVEPSLAGPRYPQERIPLREAGKVCKKLIRAAGGRRGKDLVLDHGSIVIAAITSCTNTSNPSVMLGAGLVAKRAVELGLQVPASVKTSLTPGSRVVTQYLDRAGLTVYLEALGFHLAGYGCATCIGNSGPLNPEISRAVRENGLAVASVLSGNRNFEGRIHPDVHLNFLASPPLVIAYALAGTMDFDPAKEPLGFAPNGAPVYFRDLWPGQEEIDRLLRETLGPELFTAGYAEVFTGNETWNRVKATEEIRYRWDDGSTYIRKPPFFNNPAPGLPPGPVIENARVLLMLGDTITTDHISPAGAIPVNSPAGKWLLDHEVKPEDFNTFGARRGNHEVMIRGTFANIRIRNLLVPGVEGGYTLYLPGGERMSIYEASKKYQDEGIPLLVIAGNEYGAGSSRDWAAKGTCLLGVKAVLAESFERIHRSNLIGMGVLPLQFPENENAARLGLSGLESYFIRRPEKPRQIVRVTAVSPDGREKTFSVRARIDTSVELDYYRNGGILNTVLHKLAAPAPSAVKKC